MATAWWEQVTHVCFIDCIKDLENHTSPVSPEWVKLNLDEHTFTYHTCVSSALEMDTSGFKTWRG